MNDLMKESFDISGRINLVRFGDCYKMACTLPIDDEAKEYIKHIDYVFRKCKEILDNNGNIAIYQTAKCTGSPDKLITTKKELEKFKKHFDTIYK
ncbi:hypothetical protein [Peptoclostridium acidaminophilum]|uniref:hypothetical protein n=1 Tax=Peptoclostridium acidaminophilum TaxID=1731 RepID=UPI00046D2C2F|nr:hypothetical protein [Peptoclostridium acidaminophilum]